MNNKVVIICGPTATGKTALALKLAEAVGGEIVSADSRQVYRGMDVGTGKGLPINLKSQISNLKIRQEQLSYYEVGGVRIWLYDVVPPDRRFSVAEYVPLAKVVIKDIWERGKIPLIVGGTGLYIDSIFFERETFGVLPDLSLRKELELKTVSGLVERLEKLNPEKLKAMNSSDRSNPRRLIRAIEVATCRIAASAEPPRNDYVAMDTTPLNPIYFGLTSSLSFLYKKIDERVDAMVEDGLLTEIRELVSKYGWTAPGMSGIGYRQFQPYFENKASLEECVARVKFDTHAYARRQMTWFKRNKNITWFDVGTRGLSDALEINSIIKKLF